MVSKPQHPPTHSINGLLCQLFITMNSLQIILLVQIVRTYGYETSFETNKIDSSVYSPMFEKIIFNDVVDILNEFDNRGNGPYENNMKDESESVEDVEDLLTEYQRYIEKRLLNRRFSPFNTPFGNLDQVQNNNIFVDNQIPDNQIPNGNLDNIMRPHGISNFFFPHKMYNPPTMKYVDTNYNNPDIFSDFKSRVFDFDDSTTRSKGIFHMKFDPKGLPDNDFKIDSPKLLSDSADCICRDDQVPCECCRTCIYTRKNHNIDAMKTMFPLFKFNTEHEKVVEKSETKPKDEKRQDKNTGVNVIVKVEIQVPPAENATNRVVSNNKDYNSNRVELTTLNLPFIHFPIPLEMFGLQQIPKQNHAHKMTIHKKKKPRKNRRKVVTFHNIKVETFPPLTPTLNESNANKSHSGSPGINKPTKSEKEIFINDSIDMSGKILPEIFNSSLTGIISTARPCLEETAPKRRLSLTISKNITDYQTPTATVHSAENILGHFLNGSNLVNDKHYLENKLLVKRTKREAVEEPTATAVPSTVPSTLSTAVATTHGDLKDPLKGNKNDAKIDKSLLTDMDLLYWPTSSELLVNVTDEKNNITSMMLEHEVKKPKVKISKEMFIQDQTKALEAAVFGDVDWNDMNTVVPVLISFIGKYLQGVLTFCCDKKCHSIKCADKMCVYRTCLPQYRFNNNGHCLGSNVTDSTASLESIMELPSKIAFNTVDILQEKLTGKIYGKATICINSKCITFVSNKKVFVKSKCTIKELNALGHCPNIKNVQSASML